MLTKKEKAGIRSILESLSSDVLKSLACTVSKGNVVCVSNEDCMKAIFAFENNGEDFLHRKAISKKILMQYAFKENLPAVGDCRFKEDIVQLILKFWSSGDLQVEKYSEKGNTATPSSSTASARFTEHQTNMNHSYQFNIQVHLNSPSTNQNNHYDAQHLDYQFSKTFCSWFFNMLNQPDPQSHNFGPSHFMPLAQMFTQFVSGGNVVENSFFNNIDISNCFLDLSNNFTFNPNISAEGMRVKSDPHGLKLILICGTLLKGQSLYGTFQQSFGLMKDPSAENNWKIQVTALKYLEVQGNVLPQLDDQSVAVLEKMAIASMEQSLVRT